MIKLSKSPRAPRWAPPPRRGTRWIVTAVVLLILISGASAGYLTLSSKSSQTTNNTQGIHSTLISSTSSTTMISTDSSNLVSSSSSFSLSSTSTSSFSSSCQSTEPGLYVGGSTTMYPAVAGAATAFNAAECADIVVQQGGSGAGMEGVAEGVLDIGDASSFSAVASAVSEYPTANIQAVEVGGTALVFISNFGATSTGVCAGDLVVAITQAALQDLYNPSVANGYGSPTCTEYRATGDYAITAFTAGAGSNSPLGPTNIAAVSRADLPAGTEDMACSYMEDVCAATTNNVVTLPGLTETGDPGVLSEVQDHEYTIGFTDIGFAEGSSVTPGETTAAGVTVLAMQSNGDTTLEPDACTTYASTTLDGEDCYALPGATTHSLNAFIVASLSNISPSSTNAVYPDATSGTGLTRTFWMVTAGSPTAQEQPFLTYIRSPGSETFWTENGFYSLYQIAPITPP